MPRLPLLLLAALTVGAGAQAQAPDDRVAVRGAATLLTAVDLPATIDLAVEPVALPALDVAPDEAPAPPAVEVIDTSGDDLIAVPVTEPAPVEDLTQLRAPRAPVRMELAQTRRRVVLLPGVSTREPAPAPLTFDAGDASFDSTSAHVVYSRAMVVVGESGRREVRYVTARASALDLGTASSCAAGTLPSGLQLRGLRASPLRRGMSGDAVRAMQALLCTAGYDVDSDGVFDGALDQTVRQFQRDHNASGRGRTLSVDGAFGYRTRQAVEAAIAAR